MILPYSREATYSYPYSKAQSCFYTPFRLSFLNPYCKMNCFLRENLTCPWFPLILASEHLLLPLAMKRMVYRIVGLSDTPQSPPLCISNELGYYSLASIFVNITGMS